MIAVVIAVVVVVVVVEQQCVAVGPGNTYFISISQVSSDAAALQRAMCRHLYAAAAAAHTALGNLLIKN